MPRSVIVTGGFGVLGQAVAEAFAAQGDKVARIDFVAAAKSPLAGALDIGGVDLTDRASTEAALAKVVAANDGTIAAVLGASPGASVAVAVMLDVLNKMYAKQLPAWKEKLSQMLMSYGRSIADDAELCASVRAETADALHLLRPVTA